MHDTIADLAYRVEVLTYQRMHGGGWAVIWNDLVIAEG